MTRGVGSRSCWIAFALSLVVAGVARSGDAQEAPLLESPPKAHDSTVVSEEGVPEEAVEAEEGVTEVEEAFR